MAHYDEWSFKEVWESPWFYSFADLDRNGRLEVAAATLQGTGLYTTANYYEVSSDFTGIVPCTYELEEGGSFPDVISDAAPVPCYFEPSTGRYYYLFTDIVRSGFQEAYIGVIALCLHDGQIDLIPVASRYEYYSDVDVPAQITYRNSRGEEISQAEYENAVVNRFGNHVELVDFTWTRVEIEPPQEEASSSWIDADSSDFSEPAVDPIVITKNPTSEAIAIGGKTWFIAHADKASSLTWQFVSPDGTVYSLDAAGAANPGLVLEALEGDTLAVSNVPLSFNGWGVQAVFEGGGSRAVTEPAYIYVGDFVTAYNTVLEKYRMAYTSGRTDAGYAWENGISEIIAYSTGAGYALKDVDKNGVPELIIAGLGTEDFSNSMVYDLYTLINGAPVNIVTSQARDRFYLRTDNVILEQGSSGAGFSSNTLYRLSGQMLSPLENVMTFFPGNEKDGFYMQSGHATYEPQQGDAKVDEAAFRAKVAEYEAKIYVPPLTKIA